MLPFAVERLFEGLPWQLGTTAFGIQEAAIGVAIIGFVVCFVAGAGLMWGYDAHNGVSKREGIAACHWLNTRRLAAKET